jgi:low affinity Fe/Cu permease
VTPEDPVDEVRVDVDAGRRSPAILRPAARHMITHPADRTEGDQRGQYERLAECGSFLASSPLFFAIGVAAVLMWTIGLAAGASERFETAAAGAISSLTLVLVALLKNSELRAERAVQRKLDAIASSLLEDKRGTERDAEGDLERAIGVHEQI